MKYFTGIDCIEELKKQYYANAKKLHSDINGGSDEPMKQLNSEYQKLFEKFKNIHRSTKKDSNETTYTAKEATKEDWSDFVSIVNALLFIDGINVELCGRWLWITGDTKPHKDKLKRLGCKWSQNKMCWSWHYPEDTPRKHKAWDMDKIRNSYGSLGVRLDEQLLLA